MNRAPIATWVGVALIGVLFGWLIWPTPYRYDHMSLGNRTLPVRINRFSDETQVLNPSGWSIMHSGQQSVQTLSGADLAKLVPGQAEITYDGELRADIYNGTDKKIPWVTIELTLKSYILPEGAQKPGIGGWIDLPQKIPQKIVFVRQYRLSTLLGGPLSSSTYQGTVGFHLSDGQAFSWRILEAEIGL